MMTNEELKKDAEKSLDKRLGTYAYIRRDDCYINYVDGYIDGAEPREKQLTKAKEIIKKLMTFAEMDNREYEEDYKEAEQFLKEDA